MTRPLTLYIRNFLIKNRKSPNSGFLYLFTVISVKSCFLVTLSIISLKCTQLIATGYVGTICKPNYWGKTRPNLLPIPQTAILLVIHPTCTEASQEHVFLISKARSKGSESIGPLLGENLYFYYIPLEALHQSKKTRSIW